MNRTTKFFSICTVVLACLPVATFAQNPAPSATHGAYPTNYQEIVTAWLNTHLDDPKSALIKWLGEPKPAELPAENGQKIAGYLVEFTVNARNRFGAPTGPQKHGVLIRDGEVVKATGGFGYR